MAASNDFLPFAIGSGANVEDQTTWESDAVLDNGFSSGIASSAKMNKALRQGTFVAAAVAAWVAEQLDAAVLDDGALTTLRDQVGAAIGAYVAQQGYLTASGAAAAYAPIPTSNGAVPGAFLSLAVGANTLTLPPGGTWAWFYSNNNAGGQGISAGGTVVFTGTINNESSWCWRIA